MRSSKQRPKVQFSVTEETKNKQEGKNAVVKKHLSNDADEISDVSNEEYRMGPCDANSFSDYFPSPKESISDISVDIFEVTPKKKPSARKGGVLLQTKDPHRRKGPKEEPVTRAPGIQRSRQSEPEDYKGQRKRAKRAKLAESSNNGPTAGYRNFIDFNIRLPQQRDQNSSN